jgi:hypothetical protein
VTTCEACVRVKIGGGLLTPISSSKAFCSPRLPLLSLIGTLNLWEWAANSSICKTCYKKDINKRLKVKKITTLNILR